MIQKVLRASLLFLVATIVVGAPAGAAGRVVDSSPRAGDVLRGPLPTIWLRFDEPLAARADMFSVVDGDGVAADFELSRVDTVVTLRFDPPLPAHRYRVEWTVSGNTQRGVLPFEVIVDSTGGGWADANSPDNAPLDVLVDPSGNPVDVDSAEARANDGGAGEGGQRAATAVTQAGADEDPAGLSALEELRADFDGKITWERLEEGGRFVATGGLLVAFGGLLFVGLALRGRPEEVELAVHWVRTAAFFGVLGHLVELGGGIAPLISAEPERWGDPNLWATVFDAGYGVRLATAVVGAVLVASTRHKVGLYAVVRSSDIMATRTLVGPDGRPVHHAHLAAAPRGEPDWAYDLASAPAAQVGAGTMMVSLAIDAVARHDGSIVVGALTLLHVASAAVWCGVGMLALLLLTRRYVQRQPMDAARVIAASSTLVVAAIAVVLLSGVLLEVASTDGGLGDLGTDLSLLIKALAGAIAATLAVANRKVFAPHLVHTGSALTTLTRVVLSAEAAMLAIALAATAISIA